MKTKKDTKKIYLLDGQKDNYFFTTSSSDDIEIKYIEIKGEADNA